MRMFARKHIVHPTLYVADAVVVQFVPFWFVTFTTGGLLVATAMAYRHEIQGVCGRAKGWLSRRKPEVSRRETVPQGRPAFWAGLTKFAVLMVVVILAFPLMAYGIIYTVTASFGFWVWVFGETPTFMGGFNKSWEGVVQLQWLIRIGRTGRCSTATTWVFSVP